MSEETLAHVIYTSAVAPGLDTTQLESILRASRVNNARRGLTGMLLAAEGTFFQVLEGDQATLRPLFAIIKADARHSGVTMIIQEPIAARTFGDWTMGFAEISPVELANIDGLSDFFKTGGVLSGLQPGRAKKILTAFAQGRWRNRLD